MKIEGESRKAKMKHKRFDNLVKQTARRLRKEQTNSEFLLWQLLRDRKLQNKKFLRQYPIVFDWEGKKRFFIADFYCHEACLVVELDGDVHLQRKDHDKARDRILKSIGIKVVRIRNEDVASNMKRVISFVIEQLNINNDYIPSLIKRGGLKG